MYVYYQKHTHITKQDYTTQNNMDAEKSAYIHNW